MTQTMETTALERRCGALAHTAPLLVVLVVWWLKRGSVYVAAHARASVNFQITMLVFCGLGVGYVQVYSVFGLTILLSSFLLDTVSALMAARRALQGKHYEYRISLAVFGGRGG